MEADERRVERSGGGGVKGKKEKKRTGREKKGNEKEKEMDGGEKEGKSRKNDKEEVGVWNNKRAREQK